MARYAAYLETESQEGRSQKKGGSHIDSGTLIQSVDFSVSREVV